MDSYEEVDDFLEHFGVKGMRWGQRRRRESRNTTYDRNTRGLSERELNARIQRMELERHYHQLNTPQRSEGAAFANQVMRSSGAAVITSVAGAAAAFAVQRALSRRFGAIGPG
jgi:hypothetical protein